MFARTTGLHRLLGIGKKKSSKLPNHCKCLLRNVQTSRIKDFIYLYICNFFGGSGEGKAQSRVDLLAFTCICPSKH
jgi:hypothetical protein